MLPATLARKKSASSAKKSPSRKPAARKAPTATARSKKQKGGRSGAGLLRHVTRQAPPGIPPQRWWYAYDWPAPQAIEKEPEAGFESPRGLPRRAHLHARGRQSASGRCKTIGTIRYFALFSQFLQTTVSGTERAMSQKRLKCNGAAPGRRSRQPALHQQAQKGAEDVERVDADKADLTWRPATTTSPARK